MVRRHSLAQCGASHRSGGCISTVSERLFRLRIRDALSAIRGEFPDARIMVLTSYAGDIQVSRAIRSGARGYLLKDMLRKALLETIRAVHSGQKRLSSKAASEIAENATDDALTHGKQTGCV